MSEGPAPAEARTRDLLARVRRAVALASRMSSSEAAGAYRSTFKGQGLDFAELDEYSPGDDVRHIDWNATGRMGKPFVRRYHEEREGTVMLVVNRGRQMHFGSSQWRKADTAAEAAALLAVLAVRNRDRVGLVTYGEEQPMGLAPAKGMDPAMRIIREVLVGGAGEDWAWRGVDGRLRTGAEAHMAAGAAPDDVTGGVAAKVREAAGAAERGVPVLIAQAGSPAGMLAVMRGAGAIHCGWAGTLIIRRPPGAQQ